MRIVQCCIRELPEDRPEADRAANAQLTVSLGMPDGTVHTWDRLIDKQGIAPEQFAQFAQDGVTALVAHAIANPSPPIKEGEVVQ